MEDKEHFRLNKVNRKRIALRTLSAKNKTSKGLQKMYFKLEHVLNDLGIDFRPSGRLLFEFGGHENILVTIRVPTEEEEQKYKAAQMCTALSDEEPPNELRPIFDRLANNLMPEGVKKEEVPNVGVHQQIDESGRIKEGYVPSVSLFPEQFRAFESDLLHRLTECIRRTAKIIRWRNSPNRTSHNPIRSTLGMSWSFDGQGWHPMPHGLVFGDAEFTFYLPVSNETHLEMQSLLKDGRDEPLGHELFLEAWELRSRNPRSSLIIGMSAAEVSFKQCIGKLVPDAEWLASNVPTPPLDKMLSSYLPLLPARLTIEERVLKPPKSIRKAIEYGIRTRNLVVHVGGKPPKPKELKELLLCVRDLLYLLDGYCGFEWAFDNLREEIKQEMRKEFGLKPTTFAV